MSYAAPEDRLPYCVCFRPSETLFSGVCHHHCPPSTMSGVLSLGPAGRPHHPGMDHAGAGTPLMPTSMRPSAHSPTYPPVAHRPGHTRPRGIYLGPGLPREAHRPGGGPQPEAAAPAAPAADGQHPGRRPPHQGCPVPSPDPLYVCGLACDGA